MSIPASRSPLVVGALVGLLSLTACAEPTTMTPEHAQATVTAFAAMHTATAQAQASARTAVPSPSPTPETAVAGVMTLPQPGVTPASASARPSTVQTPIPAPSSPLGRVLGPGCYEHHPEGRSWPERVDGVEGVVTCSNNLYYFKPAE